MSHPYISNALPEMVRSTQDKLRQQRTNLWRAKSLNRQLIGDESWIPCEAVESPDDWNLFEPAKRAPRAWNGTKRRKIDDNSTNALNGVGTDTIEHPHASNSGTEQAADDGMVLDSLQRPMNEPIGQQGTSNRQAEQVKKEYDESGTVAGSSLNAHLQDVNMPDVRDDDKPHHALNGISHPDKAEGNVKGADAGENVGDKGGEMEMQGEEADGATEDDSESPSPPPPPRRITRALAANNISNPQSGTATPPVPATPTLSPASESILYEIDPIFLLPPSVRPPNSATSFHGLPAEEALETRRLLTNYIQKLEESVRGYEAVLNKLLKAKRLRDEVLEMCKAEGHVGEMSDGEDWIDNDYWGLQQGELRKGRDEDEDAVEENTIGGRKGKRRARN